MAKQGPTFTSAFTLGGQQAEADPLFDEAFLETGEYAAASSKEDKRCFIVGRTGAGKSALLQRLEERAAPHVIRINPDDLALPYITNLQAIRFLDGLQINLDTFWIALWKHVLLVEIIRHRYKIDSPSAKQNFLSVLRGKITKDRAKTAALEYLDEYEGRFWCEADERVREITDKFAQKIEGEAGGNLAGAASFGVAGTYETSSESRGEQIERFQRIVNDTQLARLNKMISVLDEDVLNESQHYTFVVIDDLDREWVDERIANDLIRCLFQTVLDLKKVRHLKVLVALRTNIFQELDFSRRGGGQEEKFRALVLKMQWTRAELIQLLDQRLEVVSFKSKGTLGNVASILPNANRSRGNPIDYILDRTLMRPRDAIAFLNECLIRGRGKSKLAWTEIQGAESEYSLSRLQALRDEWKSTYPGIDQVLEVFRRSPGRMTKDQFSGRLSDVAMLLASPEFPGVRWLTDATATMFAAGDATWYEQYQPLFKILYEIGYVGLSTGGSGSPIFYLSDQLVPYKESILERSTWFFVHRTFHVALDIEVGRGES